MMTLQNAAETGRMGSAIRRHLLDAADRTKQFHPGPVGELLRQELLSRMVFGTVPSASDRQADPTRRHHG
jgi:hypothetical protein